MTNHCQQFIFMPHFSRFPQESPSILSASAIKWIRALAVIAITTGAAGALADEPPNSHTTEQENLDQTIDPEEKEFRDRFEERIREIREKYRRRHIRGYPKDELPFPLQHRQGKDEGKVAYA